MFAEAGPLMLHGLIGSALLLFMLWIIQYIREDAGVVDLGWTLGVGLLAIYYALRLDGWIVRRILVAVLAGGWSFRLAWYILTDRVLKGEEDGRYQRMRAHWGDKARLYFIVVFVPQSILVVLFSMPFIPIVQYARDSLTAWDIAGILLWIAANAGESLADHQLKKWRTNPENKGKTCRAGLWKYSRHPNYFFEWLHWWSYVLIGVAVPGGWMTLIGPVVMFVFLFRITGIPYTEQQALASRGDDYREYQKSTSAFFPLPPKKGAS